MHEKFIYNDYTKASFEKHTISIIKRPKKKCL